MTPRPTTIAELLATHAGVLLDAFGVLIDARGALPGALALIRELDRRRLPFAIVSNDASRSGATYAAKFAALGMPVAAERFVTSGTLLPDYFRERGLAGARTCVLGTEDSCELVRAGGGVPIPLAAGMEIDAVAVCDDDGTPFVEGIERAASAIVRAVHAGRRPALVAPNPDLIYPKADDEIGITAGAMAVMIELAVARKLPHAGLAFDRLGKPAPLLFTTAARRLGVPIDRLVMIGDQLETDIAGAAAAGVASALVAGISRWSSESVIAPTYLLATIEP
jgi:HAD superfamily hydrolase (TIGR01450 family)